MEVFRGPIQKTNYTQYSLNKATQQPLADNQLASLLLPLTNKSGTHIPPMQPRVSPFRFAGCRCGKWKTSICFPRRVAPSSARVGQGPERTLALSAILLNR